MRAQRKAHILEHRGKHTYEPAQPKGTGTCHKSHFVQKFTGKNARPQAHKRLLCGNFQENCRTRIPGTAFCIEIQKKKITWTCHKSHLVWKFKGKIAETLSGYGILCGKLQAECRTLIPGSTFCVEIQSKKTHMDMSQGPFCVEVYRKKCCTLVRPPRSNTGS